MAVDVEKEKERIKFERWASDDFQWPQAVEPAPDGDTYILQTTQLYWIAWQARAKML